jgi:thymidylate synthase ThyX
VPQAFDEAGFGGEYRAAMQSAADAFEQTAADYPEEAAYLVPNGFNRRLLLTLNLRELFHFCELRGAPNAHFSVRRIAGQLHELAAQACPALVRFMRVDGRPNWRAIEAEYFSQV